MNEEGGDARAIELFIAEQIPTVPHLEALLLLWNSAPQRWSAAGLSERLFVADPTVSAIVQELATRGLIATEDDQYWYQKGDESRDNIIEGVAAAYRQDLVGISNLIHSKAANAVREFARAFRFTKERG